MYTIFRISRGIHKLHHIALAVPKRLTNIRKYSVGGNNKFSLTFDEHIRNRRQQAQRSIIVQVSSEYSFDELFRYCLKYGNITETHHYKIPNDNLHYILIEFENESIADAAINSSSYNDDLSGLPVRSSFLWFKATEKRHKLSMQTANVPIKPLTSINGTLPLSDIDLNTSLCAAKNIDEQIQILYTSTNLNDLGIRLRFLAARQIESSIAGMFPYANAMPFGSTVNGFGKMGCDLDLILRFDGEVRNYPPGCRLIFHTKQSLTNGRSQTQRQMETIGDILHLFLPGVSNVRRILQARVPIIKFHHGHLNLEVDLSMANLTGSYMSELLYLFGEIDERVRPLTFCLRRWAQSVGLTNPTPGRWISNFALTCLVIFFLQQLKKPILPTVNYLTKSAIASDIRLTEDGINCTFLRNCNNLKFDSSLNKDSLSRLLIEFFEFYSQFDFANSAISLNEGRHVLKPEHTAMYIINPLEQLLNVGKNISYEECERFRTEVRNAAWLLETESETITESNKSEGPWGLLNLFNERHKIQPTSFYRPRMVEVQELFETDGIDETVMEIKTRSLRSQIRNFKSKNRADLKQLKFANFDHNESKKDNKQQKGRKR